MRSKTICLNMIVKDESRVIQRCLNSIKHIIDYWVIVDTGSTDGTQNVIKECMKDIPGELYERPWVNFEYNRNEALDFAKAKADYLLFIDADEQLLFLDPLPELDKDFYFSIYRKEGFDSSRIFLVNNHLNWQWKGIIHEHPECPEAKTVDLLQGAINLANTKDGARALDPERWVKDAEVIKTVLEKDPDNPRFTFLLALAYVGSKNYPMALKMYEKRSTLPGGLGLEVYFSLYQMGLIQKALGMAPETFVPNYLKAYQFRPKRAEPLYYLVKYYIEAKHYLLGYLVSKLALTIPHPNEYYFTIDWIYQWGLLHQFIICSLEINNHEEAQAAINKILAINNLPSEIRTKIENYAKNNWNFHT